MIRPISNQICGFFMDAEKRYPIELFLKIYYMQPLREVQPSI